MFALRYPKNDDKPKARIRKEVFATAPPKKKAPKLQFSTANIRMQVSNDTEQVNNKAVVQKAEGKLQQWLKAGNADRPGCEEAREYLLRGIPYRGTHAVGSKDVIKEAGARWMPNPLKIDTNVAPWIDGMSNGWFAAHTDNELVALLRLPYVKKYLDPRMMKSTVPQWSPIDVPQKSHSVIVLLIREFEAFEQDESEYAQKTAVRERDAQKAANRSAQEYKDIPADSTADTEELKRKWNIDWTDEMSAWAIRCPKLGPHSGISSARRALRGLHLQCCTVNEVLLGEYGDNTLSNGKSTSADVVDYTKVLITSAISGCHIFGKGPGMLQLPSDREWEQIRDASATRYRKSIKGAGVADKSPYLQTWCTSCVGVILQQFGDCSCFKDGKARDWKWCYVCYGAYDGDQLCRCASPGEWDGTQEETKQEAQKRTEKAESVQLRQDDLCVDVVWKTNERKRDGDDNASYWHEGKTLHSIWSKEHQ